jgi:hypothetical protein
MARAIFAAVLGVALAGCAVEQRPPAQRVVVVRRAARVQYYRTPPSRSAVPARATPYTPAATPARVSSPDPAPAPYSAYVPWGERTVELRLDEIGPRARERWRRSFRAAGIGYPAASVVLVAFKRERKMEVYAGSSPSRLRFVRRIAITAASGGPGPKLREGDGQVPEGIYSVDRLNPNSAYHVSLHLDYPNDFDEAMARRDGRRRLGGQIMIHGNAKSIGCIAVGDQAAEDIFVLAADAGVGATKVVIVPRDFRGGDVALPARGQPSWVRDLYARLDLELRALPASRRPALASPARPKTAAIGPR